MTLWAIAAHSPGSKGRSDTSTSQPRRSRRSKATASRGRSASRSVWVVITNKSGRGARIVNNSVSSRVKRLCRPHSAALIMTMTGPRPARPISASRAASRARRGKTDARPGVSTFSSKPAMTDSSAPSRCPAPPITPSMWARSAAPLFA
jgi:hypothetical protein